jgi:hypothetical protein
VRCPSRPITSPVSRMPARACYSSQYQTANATSTQKTVAPARPNAKPRPNWSVSRSGHSSRGALPSEGVLYAE